MRGTRRRRVLAAGVVAVAAALAPTGGAEAQRATRGDLFERLAGSWSGAGNAAVAGGSQESIRCRADFSPSGPTQIHIGLRCASDAFNLQVESDLARSGDRLAGSWTETGTGASGDVSGGAGADRFSVAVTGTSLSARLSTIVRGDTQLVTIVSQGQLAASASILLRRR